MASYKLFYAKKEPFINSNGRVYRKQTCTPITERVGSISFDLRSSSGISIKELRQDQ